MLLEELKKNIVKILDDMKIDDIEVLDVEKKTSLTKLIIIGTGHSSKHLESSLEKLRNELKIIGIKVPKIQGKSSEWLLLDLDDVFVNLFTEECRKKYNLEDLWKKER